MPAMYGHTSAQMRELYLEWHLRPLAQRIFERAPDARSVTLAVAQYWDDNASDAVHDLVVVSDDVDPRWPDCTLETNRYMNWDDPLRHLAEDVAEELYGAERNYFDDNLTLITAFGAYCKPGGDQNYEYGDSYTPYAVARRVEARRTDAEDVVAEFDVTIEVVGTVQQPQWEDARDVSFRRYAEGWQEPDAPDAAEALAESVRAWQVVSRLSSSARGVARALQALAASDTPEERARLRRAIDGLDASMTSAARLVEEP